MLNTVYICLVQSPEQISNLIAWKKLNFNKSNLFVVVQFKIEHLGHTAKSQYDAKFRILMLENRISPISERLFSFIFPKLVFFYPKIVTFLSFFKIRLCFVLGGFSGYYNKQILLNSKLGLKVIVDDGLETLDLDEMIGNSIDSCLVFSKYYNFLDPLKVSVFPNNSFFKFDNHLVIEDGCIFMFGGPYVETGFLSQFQYLELIKEVISNFSARKIYYFAHRRENTKVINEIGLEFYFIQDESKSSLEIIQTLGFIGGKVWSVNSSVLVDLFLASDSYELEFYYSNIDHLIGDSERKENFQKISKSVFELYSKLKFVNLHG